MTALPRCHRSLTPNLRQSGRFSVLYTSHNYAPTPSRNFSLGSYGACEDAYYPDSDIHQDSHGYSESISGIEVPDAETVASTRYSRVIPHHLAQRLRVVLPDSANETEPSYDNSRYIFSPQYLQELRAYNNRYQPNEDSSILANEPAEAEDSITATSSRIYRQYNAVNPHSQRLTFHHGNYPTRNPSWRSTSSLHLDAANSQFVNLNDHVRVELSYLQRDFRQGAGVVSDCMLPNRGPNGAVVATSYQQIEGVGYERPRDWTGRPLLEVGINKKSVLGIVAISIVFVCLVIMSLKVRTCCLHNSSLSKETVFDVDSEYNIICVLPEMQFYLFTLIML